MSLAIGALSAAAGAELAGEGRRVPDRRDRLRGRDADRILGPGGAARPVGRWWNPVAKYVFVGVASLVVVLQIAFRIGQGPGRISNRRIEISGIHTLAGLRYLRARLRRLTSHAAIVEL